MSSPITVAYITSRFPKLSETFIVGEMLALQDEGIRVEVFPLIREREHFTQPDAIALAERARFQPVLSPAIVRSILAWIVENPFLLVRTILSAVRGVRQSRSFTFGLIGLLPKTLHNARVMRSIGVDHIHAHFAHHPTLAALIIHRLTGIPFSFTGHGHDVHVDRTMLCEKLEAAEFAVAIAEHNRDLTVGDCDTERVRRPILLHTGVDPDAIAPGSASAWAEGRWLASPRRVLAVGRLEEVKGHRVLLDALTHLRQRGRDVQAIVLGDGPMRSDLERQRSALGLDDLVQLPGSVPHDRVLDLMRSADVVVLPSVPTSDGRVEGIPVVLMEAMSLGTPVVASDLPGVVELFGRDAGLQFPAGDEVALDHAIDQVLSDQMLADRLTEAGRQRVLDEFDRRKTARELATRFRASAARHAGAPKASES